jgi:transcription elongation factor Elf1
MKCPKCHSTRVENTTLGSVEQAGTYAAAVLGIAAAKVGIAMLGGRSKTPSWDSVKKGTDGFGIPRQFKCLRCGHVFHGRDY